MDAKLKQKWVEALRSGKYTQLRHGFYDSKHHCCLAVLSAVAGDAPLDFPDGAKIGLPRPERTALIEMNDREGSSFAEIADYIEKNL